MKTYAIIGVAFAAILLWVFWHAKSIGAVNAPKATPPTPKTNTGSTTDPNASYTDGSGSGQSNDPSSSYYDANGNAVKPAPKIIVPKQTLVQPLIMTSNASGFSFASGKNS